MTDIASSAFLFYHFYIPAFAALFGAIILLDWKDPGWSKLERKAVKLEPQVKTGTKKERNKARKNENR